MNIYVGNISRHATEADLKEAFEAHGAVSSVAIIKDKLTGDSRGFGFVEMPNKDEVIRTIYAKDELSAGPGPHLTAG